MLSALFFDPEHRDKAKIGKHIHVEDLRSLFAVWKAEHIVVVHASRRTMLSFAREQLCRVAGDRAENVHLLMDFRANRKRLEIQSADFDQTEPSDTAPESSVIG